MKKPFPISSLAGAALLAALLLSLGACGHDLPDVDCNTAQPPSFSDVTLLSSCVGCHSSELSGSARNGAPSDIDFDTYASAMEHAEHGAGEVYEGAMPPSGTVSADVKDAFYAWALCDTPQ